MQCGKFPPGLKVVSSDLDSAVGGLLATRPGLVITSPDRPRVSFLCRPISFQCRRDLLPNIGLAARVRGKEG
jgi:hypothetical protein